MVETAPPTELQLQPAFKANAGSKFMSTLQKPRKIFGVKSGKIPLVHNVSSVLDPKHEISFSRGPTLEQIVVEDEEYEFMEDESHSASKEVERLEDSVMADVPKSGIIERITESRHERHKKAVDDLHEELGLLSKSFDPQVHNTLELSSEQMLTLTGEVKMLYAGIESLLPTFPLKQLDSLWDNTIRLLQKRATIIDLLRDKLDMIEVDRSEQISELLKTYHKLFRDISYLSYINVDRFMDKTIYECNRILLVNKKKNTDMIAQLLLENAVLARKWRVTWEQTLASWRDLHIKAAITKFSDFMGTPAITDCPDMRNMVGRKDAEVEGMKDRRANKVESMSSLRPPKLKQSDVLNWYDDVCSISQQLESTHLRYMEMLQNLVRRMKTDCEGVVDKMLYTLKDEGVTSESEAAVLKNLYFLPLIESWNSENQEQLDRFEVVFFDEEAEFKANVQMLYEFHKTGANIWSSHQIGIHDMNNELVEQVKQCRAKHDDINQKHETFLDVLLDKMRQDTSDIELDRHFDQAKDFLDTIASAYNNFQNEMTVVIESYPKMILNKFEVYCTQIKVHLGVMKVSSMSVIKEETEDELRAEISDNSLIVSRENTKLSSRGEVTGEDEEKTAEEEKSVIIAEVLSVADVKEQISHEYSVPYIAGVAQELVEIYLNHIDVLKEEVMETIATTVEERLCELKSEVELRHHIHKPRALRMKLDIYNVRLNELKFHAERIKQHAAGITLEISLLKEKFKELSGKHTEHGKQFKELVDSCISNLPELEKTTHLTALQSRVNTANEEHKNNIKHDLSMFRNKMEEKLNDLRESNQHFGLAFKPFTAGGNFGPDEVEKYRRVLEKCNHKIDNCETFILTEIDGMESRCLEAAADVTNNFDTKFKLHMLEVMFLEKTNSWMSNCQVKIKTEVAASNRMSKSLKKSIEELKNSIDNCANPHPDKPRVIPEEIVSHIPLIYSMVAERIKYLDCAKDDSPTAVTITEETPSSPSAAGATTTDQQEHYDLHSTISLTKNIMKISKKKSSIARNSAHDDKRKIIDINYEWFLSKEDKLDKIIVTKRSKMKSDASDKPNKRSGSASSRSSLMSTVLKDVQSFIPIVKKILQETQASLFISSEQYYSQVFTPPLRPSMADSFELCMDSLNKRLNNYYIQADEYYNKCIDDLRDLIKEVTTAHNIVPSLLYRDILEKSLVTVTQQSSEVKLMFEKNCVKMADRRNDNKEFLKPILGHPNNEVDLNNLCRREEDRAIESKEILSAFANDLKNIETASAKQFLETLNECTCRLLNLFDDLVTTDDVIKSKAPDKKLPPSVLLKQQHIYQNSNRDVTSKLVEPGRVISLPSFTEIIGRPASSSSRNATDSIKTTKFTVIHDVTVKCMRKVYNEFKKRYSEVMIEIDGIHHKWTTSEEKWKAQWVESVQRVKELYNPP